MSKSNLYLSITKGDIVLEIPKENYVIFKDKYNMFHAAIKRQDITGTDYYVKQPWDTIVTSMVLNTLIKE